MLKCTTQIFFFRLMCASALGHFANYLLDFSPHTWHGVLSLIVRAGNAQESAKQNLVCFRTELCGCHREVRGCWARQ